MSAIHAAGLDELDDAIELLIVEPHATFGAGVDNHAGDAGKVSPVHQVLTVRTGNVLHCRFRRQLEFGLAAHGRQPAHGHAHTLFVTADRFKFSHGDPQPGAASAFVNFDFFEHPSLQRNGTARTGQRAVDVFQFLRIDLKPALDTVAGIVR